MPTPIEIMLPTYAYCQKAEDHCICPTCTKKTICMIEKKLCDKCQPSSGDYDYAGYNHLTCRYNLPPMKEFKRIMEEWEKEKLLKEKYK